MSGRCSWAAAAATAVIDYGFSAEHSSNQSLLLILGGGGEGMGVVV